MGTVQPVIVFGVLCVIMHAKKKVSIPHRYGTTTDFIRSLVFIILLFPRFSTFLAKKVGLPRARNPLFPAFFKTV